MLSLELLRCRSFQKLKSEFNEVIFAAVNNNVTNSNQNNNNVAAATAKLKRHVSEGFHRWFFDASGVKKLSTSADPLLLSAAMFFDPAVVTRLEASTIELVKNSTESDRTRVADAVGKKLRAKYDSIQRDFVAKVSENAQQQQQQSEPPVTSTTSGTTIWLAWNGVSLPLDQARFAKLQTDFNTHCDDKNRIVQSSAEERQSVFLRHVFTMLLRYAALSDDSESTFGPACMRRSSLSGTGQHSAVPPAVFTELNKWMGVTVECFASPLNAFCSEFCSAFLDTDRVFGSLGSFFEFNEIPGECFSAELNPPFVEDVMERAVAHVESLLFRNKDKAVSFVIVMPHWVSPPTAAITNARKNVNGFLRADVVLAAGEHGFVDGAQHRVGAQEYRPSHETVMFVMQNDLGAKKWPFTENVQQRVKEAFFKGQGSNASAAAPAASVAGNKFRGRDQH